MGSCWLRQHLDTSLDAHKWAAARRDVKGQACLLLLNFQLKRLPWKSKFSFQADHVLHA